MGNKLVSISLTTIFLLSSVAVLPMGRADSINLSFLKEDIIEMIQQVNESLVFYYHNNLMKFGPRYTGSENCTLAGQYIYEEFEKMGLDVEFHEWKCKGFNGKDVVATLVGNDKLSTAIFIICAHYDTTETSPGADDDGSGVAGVLAIAKVMSQYSFNHTLRFIAFSGEEVGTCGSFTYARDAYNKGDNIVAVLSPDMIGYANTGEGGKIINFYTPERSKWISEFADEINVKYQDYINITVRAFPNYIGADHQAFVYYGYDGAWIAHSDGYPWGHSPNDTADHINWTYQIKATKFLLSVLAELAIKPIDIQAILKTPREGYSYLLNKPIVPVPGRKWGKGLRGTTFLFGRAVASADVISKEKIRYVIFCIDGDFMYWDTEPPYEWKIQGKFTPLRGRHTLSVYAYTTSGKMATDEMDIIIFTHSFQYRKW
jgi:hypothetical protein